MSSGAASPDFGAVGRVFYCIGAQKAGTTWLYEALRGHPDVHLSRIKEVHYWDTVFPPHLPYYVAEAEAAVAALDRSSLLRRAARRLVPGRARAAADARRYHEMFARPDPRHLGYQRYLMAEWAGQPVAGDISPGYAMMGAEGFAAMDAASPDARFVFVLRDPVGRLWSNVRHNRSRGFRDAVLDDLDTTFRRHLDDPTSGPFQRSDYARTIRALESVVPRDRIAYFFFETLFDPAEMGRLAEFLGIAPIGASLGRRVNPGASAEARPSRDVEALARARLASVYDFAAERFGDALPEAWRSGAPA